MTLRCGSPQAKCKVCVPSAGSVSATGSQPNGRQSSSVNRCGSSIRVFTWPAPTCDASVLGVVDRAGVRRTDRKRERADRRVLALRPDRVRDVRRRVDEIALLYVAFLVTDLHDATPADDVVELVRRMAVRVDETAALDLELTHQLEVSALRGLEHLARLDQPPNRHRPVVLDGR